MAKRTPGLLITESSKVFARQHKGLADHIRPAGSVDTEYVKDIAHTNWEIERYRRIGAAILSSRMVEALQNLLKQMLPGKDYETHLDLQHAAEGLAWRYFSESEVRDYVVNLLRSYQLDETAIEAEAFRLCASELEVLNRMIAVLTGHRDKNYFVLAELRQSGFLQAPRDPVLEEIPQLVAVVKRGAKDGE
jgi:hypothetical protein